MGRGYHAACIPLLKVRVIFFPINAPGMGRFQLLNLVGYSFIRVWVRVRIWDMVRVTIRVIVTVRVRVSKELGSGYV